MSEKKLDSIRRWPSDCSQQWVSTFLARIAEFPSIQVVIAIGSAVRQRGHKFSDIDLLILYSGKRPKLRAPIEVDIHQYPLDRADKLISDGHEVLGWAIKFGHPLYDPTDAWKELCISWASQLPMPSAAEASTRADKSLALAKEMIDAGDETAASDLIRAALTQLVRSELISRGVYPASRPELMGQLEQVSPANPLSQLLEDALFHDESADRLVSKVESLSARNK